MTFHEAIQEQMKRHDEGGKGFCHLNCIPLKQEICMEKETMLLLYMAVESSNLSTILNFLANFYLAGKIAGRAESEEEMFSVCEEGERDVY